MIGEIELHNAAADPIETPRVSRTDMFGATGVVQEAGVPLRPSISMRQRRQEPNAVKLSVAQSLGIEFPAASQRA